MSHSMSRWACYLAVVCRVRLRHIALISSALFLLPLPTASIKRWIDAIGGHLPAPEAMLRPLWARPPATACHLDGDDPLGTAHWVMVVKAVWPQVRFPAEPGHTGKHSWGHLKQALLSYRRQGKANGAAQQDAACLAWATKLWTWRGSLLKKPGNVSAEEQQALTALENEDGGCVHSFRNIIRQLVPIFAHPHSAAHATLSLQQLSKDSQVVDDDHLETLLTFCDAPWAQALRYVRKKGMGKPRRGSHSESGMRLRRGLEKNYAGIRSAATRQHYIPMYQAIKYLSLDIAEFIEQGLHMAELPGV
jgi:hypothetical protein